MLGYVFWHCPHSHVRAEDYEQLEAEFHHALARAAPVGFVRSVVFGLAAAVPWLAGTPAYADWYLVDSFAALEALNTAAVQGVCQEPHARVAQAMAAGAGSLLALRSGQPELTAARTATFLTKPRDLPYAAFYAQVDALPGTRHTTLWHRTMVLGPTPEFALLSREPLSAPSLFQPVQLRLAPIRASS